MLSGAPCILLRTSTNRQARYVPGSVEGIRDALAWAGLDYDFGDHPSVGPSPDSVS